MALFVNQNSNRTKLQEQLAAELQAKAKKKAELDATLPDGVDDSQYIKGTKKTTSLAGIWIAILLLAIAVMIFVIMKVSS